MRTLLLASALMFAGLFGSVSAGPIPIPYRAFCKTMWLFAAPCGTISSKLVQQIEAFSLMSGCEECHYTLVSATPLTIRANHTSLDGLQAQTLTIALRPTSPPGVCRAAAQSTSLTVSSLLDNGLNYCNLYNLLSASGLTATPGFMEMTNEWACLGLGLATCKP